MLRRTLVSFALIVFFALPAAADPLIRLGADGKPAPAAASEVREENGAVVLKFKQPNAKAAAAALKGKLGRGVTIETPDDVTVRVRGARVPELLKGLARVDTPLKAPAATASADDPFGGMDSGGPPALQVPDGSASIRATNPGGNPRADGATVQAGTGAPQALDIPTTTGAGAPRTPAAPAEGADLLFTGRVVVVSEGAFPDATIVIEVTQSPTNAEYAPLVKVGEKVSVKPRLRGRALTQENAQVLGALFGRAGDEVRVRLAPPKRRNPTPFEIEAYDRLK